MHSVNVNEMTLTISFKLMIIVRLYQWKGIFTCQYTSSDEYSAIFKDKKHLKNI